jgi:hypothetical protein
MNNILRAFGLSGFHISYAAARDASIKTYSIPIAKSA